MFEVGGNTCNNGFQLATQQFVARITSHFNDTNLQILL